MVTKMMGLLIKMNRLNQNMSQKALCEGICVPSYLSKIENGEIIPTSEIINLLFDVLGIKYNDEACFIEQSLVLFEHYLERLTFNDFEESSKLFEEIEKNHLNYIHSPLIMDYYIIRLARYCSTPERVFFEEADYTLRQVFEQLTSKQQLFYSLYKAIDIIHTTGKYEEALTHLRYGLQLEENGHIYYWLSTTYMYEHKVLQAIEYANKALQAYLRDGNVTSLMCTYELVARIYMMNGEYQEAKKYIVKANQVCNKLNESHFKAYLYSKMAWCLLCLGELDEASKEIAKDNYPKGIMMKLEPYEVKALILYIKQDKVKLKQLINEVQEIELSAYSTVLKLMRISIEYKDFWQHPDTQMYLIDLVNETEKLPDIQHYFKKMLITYYKDNRKYKEVVMLLDV